LLAQRCAFKLIRAGLFEAFILNGGKAVARAEEDYIRLTESIRKDLQTLWVMAKEGGGKDPVPDLEEYLETLKKAGKATPAVVKVKAKQEGPAAPKESARKGPLF
jgi:hypothetical protein